MSLWTPPIPGTDYNSVPNAYLPSEHDLDVFPRDLAQLHATRYWGAIVNGQRTKAPSDYNGRPVKSGEGHETLRAKWQRARSMGGLGVAIDPPRGYVLIDFDKCITGGTLQPDVEAWVRRLDSYTEISPSGTGLHTWLRAEKPTERVKRNGPPFTVEIHGHGGNGATVTCQPLPGAPPVINERQAVLDALCAELWPEGDSARTPGDGISLDDDALFKLILASAQRAKFVRLFYDGDLSDYGGDHSAADAGLCAILAFWLNNDPARIDQWFRASELMRNKWDREDYRTRTIQYAISHTPQPFGYRPENVPVTQADYEQFRESVVSK